MSEDGADDALVAAVLDEDLEGDELDAVVARLAASEEARRRLVEALRFEALARHAARTLPVRGVAATRIRRLILPLAALLLIGIALFAYRGTLGNGSDGDARPSRGGDPTGAPGDPVLARLPPAAAAAVRRAYPDARWTSVERETEDGATVYELEATIDGAPWEITVDETGRILEAERDEDERGEREAAEEE